MTHDQWRYNQSGLNLGTAWREIGYNDSEWGLDDALFYKTTNALPAAEKHRIES